MKNSVIIKVILLVILALGLLAIMILLLANGGKTFWNFWKYKKVELYNETYSLEDIKKLDLDLTSFDVTIRDSEDNNIRVVVNGKEDRKDLISISNDENVLKVKQSAKKSICFGFCFYDDEVIIYVPKNEYNYSMKVKNVSGDVSILDKYDSNMEIETVSGDIDIEGSLDLDVKSVSGDINVKNAGNLVVKSTSGDINIDTALSVILDTKSGEVDINSTKYVELKTISGDVNINNLEIDGTSSIVTTSGEVNVYNINDVYIETKTTSGDVSISHSDRKSGNVLTIKTTSGDITVK